MTEPVHPPQSRGQFPAHRRLPPNLFGMAFGLCGLAEVWSVATKTLGTPVAVANSIYVVAGAVWVAVAALYLAQGCTQWIEDLRHPVLAPFVPVVFISGMLLSAALSRYAFGAGRDLVLVFLVSTVVLGGWMTGQWIVEDLDLESLHPGYFLPTVAGGLVGADCAAQVHLHAVAETSFGIGVVSWLLLGSMILNRLFFRKSLPAALTPTLAIELAPPVVAGVAYFALTGGAVNTVSRVLGGYAVVMALVQLRLVPTYCRLSFSPGFWAFTFSYAAAAVDGVLWVLAEHPPGATAYVAVLAAAITVLVGFIAIRSAILLARGQLFPRTTGAGDVDQSRLSESPERSPSESERAYEVV